MKSHLCPLVSIATLLLAACSGSDDDGDTSTPAAEGFITAEEAAGKDSQSDNAGTASGDEVIIDDSARSGIAGSGIVIAEDDSTSWLIPDEGASFTGPPLQAGEGPATADSCPEQDLIVTATEAAGEQICFFSAEDPDTPAARIDQVIETVEGEDFVRIRLTLNPNFVDNTYGETAVGWGENAEPPEAMAADDMLDTMPPADGKMPPADKKAKAPKAAKSHTFKDLVGSDHAEMKLTDSNGDVVLHFKVDYVSEDDSAPSGYASLGVTGGEGSVLVGQAEWILQATTSLDRNLNACGYDSFLENSPIPPTEGAEAEAENWDYRVVYEVWVSLDAFGDADFGEAFIEFVHASPSKASDNTVDVTAGPCPPDEDPPGGSGGSGGAPTTTTPGGGPSGGMGGASSAPVDIEKAR